MALGVGSSLAILSTVPTSMYFRQIMHDTEQLLLNIYLNFAA